MWQHLSSHQRHPSYTRKNSRVMPNITYGMIPTFGDYAVMSASLMPSNSVLQFCHSALEGGHYGSTQTTRKVLDYSLYWPTIFRDAHHFVSTCKKCQKAGMAMNRRHEMPQQPILFYEVFDVWGIDVMGPFPVSNGYSYILLAVDYVSRWVEAVTTRTNDAKCMTRSSSDILYELDPEIDRTLCRLRKVRSTIVSNSGSSNFASNFDNSVSVTNDSDSFEYTSFNINSNFNFRINKSQEQKQMENNDRTLKELAMPDVYPQLEPAQTYELKFGLIHLLPKFHGLASEDPHKHLKKFHMVYSMMRPYGILKNYIKMKALPFSLDGAAKDWLYLQAVLFNSWGDMKCMFLEKFFLASRTTTIRKEICGIRKHSGETLHEY
ncbi:putative mitochondrial protein, partial [Mucuna pruriens]